MKEVELPPIILNPCARPGGENDWWTEQHRGCTGSQHIAQGGLVWVVKCACPECHGNNRKPEEIKPVKT